MSSTFADELQVRLFVRAMNAHAAPSARPNALPNASAAPGAVVCPPPVLHASSPHRDRRAHDLHVPWNELVNEKNGVVIGWSIFTIYLPYLVLVWYLFFIPIREFPYPSYSMYAYMYDMVYLHLFTYTFLHSFGGVHVVYMSINTPYIEHLG